MRAAFVIFDHMTTLDFVGAFDPLGRLRTMGFLPEFEWRVCAVAPVAVDDRGLRVAADAVGEPLAGFDLVVVPGGYGTRTLRHDPAFMAWLHTAAAVPLLASVCTGSLLLGAAGFLAGLPATTHPRAVAELAPYCAEVWPDRVVDAGRVVTARGVTAAIDLGLHLVGRLAGADAQRQVAAQMDYPHLSKHAEPGAAADPPGAAGR